MSSNAMLALVNPILAVFFAATFYAVWRGQPERSYVFNWALVFLVAAAGFAIEAQRETLEDVFVSIAGNTCHGLVALFTARGLALRYRGVTADRFLVPLFLASAAGMVWFTVLSPSIVARGMSTSLGMSLMLLVGLAAIIRTSPRERIDLAIGASLAVVAALVAIRPAVSMAMSVPEAGGSVGRDSFYVTSAMLLALFAWVGFAILFLVRIAADLMRDLGRQAITDPLTGLLNRRGFFAAGQGLLDAAGPACPCALLLIDIDRFKLINDRHGHHAGDAVIRHVAERLANGSPASVIGRLGGEEYALILPATDLAAARQLAESIRCAIQAGRDPSLPAGLEVTVSIGVVATTAPVELDALLVCADKALYAAKHAGRNRVIVSAGEDPPRLDREARIDRPRLIA